MSKANEPAFPHHKRTVFHDRNGPDVIDTKEAGLTKREYFAAICLQGLLAGPELEPEVMAAVGVESLAQAAVNHANALLAELDKGSA